MSAYYHSSTMRTHGVHKAPAHFSRESCSMSGELQYASLKGCWGLNQSLIISKLLKVVNQHWFITCKADHTSSSGDFFFWLVVNWVGVSPLNTLKLILSNRRSWRVAVTQRSKDNHRRATADWACPFGIILCNKWPFNKFSHRQCFTSSHELPHELLTGNL